jgi:hypothetical protein
LIYLIWLVIVDYQQKVVYIVTAGQSINPSTARNTIDNLNAVSIATKPVSTADGKFSVTVLSWSVVVVTLAL